MFFMFEPNLLLGYIGCWFHSFPKILWPNSLQNFSIYINFLHRAQKWWWIAVKKGIRKIVDKTPANLASSRIIKRSAKNEENIKCTTTKRDERDHNWDPDEICIFTVATCKVSIKPLSFNYQLVLPIIHTATCSASRS